MRSPRRAPTAAPRCSLGIPIRRPGRRIRHRLRRPPDLRLRHGHLVGELHHDLGIVLQALEDHGEVERAEPDERDQHGLPTTTLAASTTATATTLSVTSTAGLPSF